MHVIGLDLGFGNGKKATGHTGSTSPRYDSWPAVAIPEKDVVFNVNGETVSDRRVMVDGEPWYVGVRPDLNGAQEVLDDSYVGSAPWRAHFLYGLKVDPAIKRTKLILGLPVDEWMDKERSQSLEAIAYETSRQANVSISDIEVVPQPMGAYIDANMRCDGALLQQRVLVIDPGRYSVDWTLFDEGDISHEASGSDLHGAMGRLIEGVTAEIRKRYRVKLSEGRVRKSIELGHDIMLAGEMVDCSALIASVSARVVDESLSQIKRTLRLEADVDKIVLGGGGAPFYKNRLIELFGEKKVDIAPRPVQSNVRGYWWYGAWR